MPTRPRQQRRSRARATQVPSLGGVVGGVVALVIIGVLIFFFLRKKRRARNMEGDETGAARVPMMNEKPDARSSAQYGGQSPPPTYSSPQQGYYQDMDPNKDPYQQRYANVASAPQELPGEVPSAEHRFSELHAGSSSSTGNYRASELPAEAIRASELESPQNSPRPVQSGFSTDLAKQAKEHGLGVTTEEAVKKN
ncbi:hypothetical protein N0V83_002667 [Neocucurbitaria cava]|uniref:Uncharacterized protein n=1 Tax=Neocucurbitaria cava TaxID=798079 RepID=A0A9W8YE42_9PLEO|nr:hypothetical protein N0V83_002667 [Neocucurbitaria cava]